MNKESSKNIYRTKDNKIIFGVAAGLTNYFEIDVLWIRAIFLVSCLIGGAGLIIYLILAIIIPAEETLKNNVNLKGNTMKNKNYSNSLTGGLILLTVGVIFLINNFFPAIHFGKLWPIIIIVIGISMLIKSRKVSDEDEKVKS